MWQYDLFIHDCICCTHLAPPLIVKHLIGPQRPDTSDKIVILQASADCAREESGSLERMETGVLKEVFDPGSSSGNTQDSPARAAQQAQTISAALVAEMEVNNRCASLLKAAQCSIASVTDTRSSPHSGDAPCVTSFQVWCLACSLRLVT